MIVIHCSDSSFGDAETIRRWHTDPPPKGNGWSDIGYHFVILNGQRSLKTPYDPFVDGLIEDGRPLERIGSHVRGYNRHSIGICLIGGRTPEGDSAKNGWLTHKQKTALLFLLDDLTTRFPNLAIYGHYEIDDNKTCPNLDMNALRFDYAAYEKEFHNV